MIKIVVTLALLACASAIQNKMPNDLLKQRSFWEGLLGALLTPIGDALQTTAELAAQVTAAISVGGIDAVLALINGSKGAKNARTFWEGLLGALLTPIGDALQTSAELAAQVTAAISVGGIDAVLALFNGQRMTDTDAETDGSSGMWNLVSGIVGEYYDNVISPALTGAAQNLALMAAQLVAGVAEGGLPALMNLLG
ncbi:hypothetical protein BpHYR1_018434 [Brachionus plicatilis]|uniref:Uncharacterized protein n=1 Tax=Brachionus plicatilis TaxID=10195 RepID=A0A3M7QNI9_BRAPC|nr:hypothetical protein BpHYR1_018434 [Brachionus plicatilis]